MKSDKTYQKRKKRRIGIKWKMFAILICFVFAFAFAIWVFQIRMLNFFYQGAKFGELEDTSQRISAVLNNDSLVATFAEDYSNEYYSDIWVYRLEKEGFDANFPMIYANGIGDHFGGFLETGFENLYLKAKENEGVYIAIISMKNFKESYFNFTVLDDNMGRADAFPFVFGNMRDMTVMYTSIYQIEGNEYVIIQRANISPVGTVIKALENQVLLMGTFLIVLSLVFAMIMSNLITKPIIRINNAAKNLAAGRYDADFSAHGYREIEELSETLDAAAIELSKNDKLQKELIANVSHDLRTPLTLIRGYGEVMRDIPGENTPENIQLIIDETTRLSELVNDVLDLSKIRSGAKQLQIKKFSLTECVRSALFRYDKLTAQDGYKIEFTENGDAEVFADATMILQVLYNLINNAINYSGEDKYIGVVQKIENGNVRISVIDKGEGISEEDIPYIWDRYYKVDKIHKRATVGSGLGLSIVKGILELHNATYGVSSTLGEGSVFWFELKIADDKDCIAKMIEL